MDCGSTPGIELIIASWSTGCGRTYRAVIFRPDYYVRSVKIRWICARLLRERIESGQDQELIKEERSMKRITRAGTMLTLASILNACQTTPPSPDAATAASTTARDKPVVVAKQGITPETARNLANNCFTCHGPNGRSPGSVP